LDDRRSPEGWRTWMCAINRRDDAGARDAASREACPASKIGLDGANDDCKTTAERFGPAGEEQAQGPGEAENPHDAPAVQGIHDRPDVPTSRSCAARHKKDRSPGVCRRTRRGVRGGSRCTSRAQSRIRVARSAGNPGADRMRVGRDCHRTRLDRRPVRLKRPEARSAVRLNPHESRTCPPVVDTSP
jgi:hypothetical protein